MNFEDATYYIEVSDKSKKNIGLIIGLTIAAIVVVIVIIIVVICSVKKGKCCAKNENFESATGQNLLNENLF